MSLSRYEEIMIRLVAARVAADWPPEIAVEHVETRRAAALLETHFEARESEILRQNLHIEGDPLPALLRRQAE